MRVPVRRAKRHYVLLEDTQAGNTMTRVSGGETDVTHMGNAFKCPSLPTVASADDVAVGTM